MIRKIFSQMSDSNGVFDQLVMERNETHRTGKTNIWLMKSSYANLVLVGFIKDCVVQGLCTVQ